MRFPNPNQTILFDRTQIELECFLLFCVVVAGKKASVQVELLRLFLDGNSCPFEYIRELDSLGTLNQKLKESRLGQYTKTTVCFKALAYSDLDLFTCTIDDLENIYGIGPKTARFFISCTRRNARHAVIDTHLLKYMAQYLGWKVPHATLSSKSAYKQIENDWLSHVDNLNVNPAELDLAIWKIYANRDDSDYKKLVANSSIA